MIKCDKNYRGEKNVSDISKIDKNFAVNNVNTDGIKFYDVAQRPFKIYGVHKENGVFVRMKKEIAKSVSEGVAALNFNTAGGRLRFKTNARRIVLKCKTELGRVMIHMPETGRCGFDLYADGAYYNTFIPPLGFKNGYLSEVSFSVAEMRDIVINFPLYNGVSELYVGLEEGAQIESGKEYKITTPVVFYGSSITQGGCASRPGNCYQNVLSRRLDFDYLNLGFAGCALAEDEMAEFISKLDMSAFVYDYDHNAPNADYLERTHYAMYKKIRDKNKMVPIILASAPSPGWGKETKRRIEIIKNTQKRAIAEGDKNIYFVNGMEIFESYDKDMMTIDTVHPNDFGFFCMARAFEKVLSKIL